MSDAPLLAEAELDVHVSDDMMRASIMLPRPDFGQEPYKYKARDLIQALSNNGVVYGVDQDAIIDLVEHPVYDAEIQVAKGDPLIEGTPGEYVFHFATELSTEPPVREDGTVDYMGMKTVETVEEGQIIAEYKPAIPGVNGRNVLGMEVRAKLVRELPPLRGTGFERSEDGLTYTATKAGKIEVSNEGKRITISPIYEISGNVGVDIGNVDFRGDVVIHGSVSNGASVIAAGNVTIDGIVENCNIQAKGNLFLKGGVKGNGRTVLKAGGDVKAQFIEFAQVRAGGNIQADVFFNSDVSSDMKILMTGEHSSVLGGTMAAVEGIEAYTVGNAFGVVTKLFAGVSPQRSKEMAILQRQIDEIQKGIDRIQAGITKFDIAAKAQGNTNYRGDPRRTELLRVKIKNEALQGEYRLELENIKTIMARGKRATIKVFQNVYPGVEVGISDKRLILKEPQDNIEFVRNDNGIRMEKME